MEGIGVTNKVETVEVGDRNQEAEARILEMFNNHEITPEMIKAHGVLAERF